MRAAVDKAWEAHVVAARAQTLEDLALSGAAAVALLVGSRPSLTLVRSLRQDALERGFVVAASSLEGTSLHELDRLVAHLAAHLEGSDFRRSRGHGLSSAIRAFASEHGRRAVSAFEDGAAEEGLEGELFALTREALESIDDSAATARLEDWLEGYEVREEDDDLRLLSTRTAKRSLAQFTRLIRALGYRGIRIVFSDAHALAGLPRGRREVAYSVLRELTDNADGDRGMVAAEVLLVGGRGLVDRVTSVREHPALASRLVGKSDDALSTTGPPSPHQTLQLLDAPEDMAADELGEVPEVRPVPHSKRAALRTHLRLIQGLPPLEANEEVSVGMDAVKARVDKLFDHASRDGSVFATLVGEYGSGKTHHLLFLEQQALDAGRPVLRLAVERLDEDLGNPQRHLRRLLELGILPDGKPTLAAFTTREMAQHRSRPTSTESNPRRDHREVPEAARAADRAIGDAADDDVEPLAAIETSAPSISRTNRRRPTTEKMPTDVYISGSKHSSASPTAADP